jgi:hypothetical protein
MRAELIDLETEICIGTDWIDSGLEFDQPDGNLLDLTGWSYQSQIRYLDGSLAAQVGLALVGASRLMLSLDRAVTATLKPGKCNWDLLLQDASGDRRRYVRAVIPVVPGVTGWA